MGVAEDGRQHWSEEIETERSSRSERKTGVEEVIALKQRHAILQIIRASMGNQWSCPNVRVMCTLAGARNTKQVTQFGPSEN